LAIGLVRLGAGFEEQEALGRKAGRLMRQAIERCDKEAGGEVDEKTERHLHRNECVHQPAAGVRIFPALERADWLDGGSSQRGHEAEQERERRPRAAPRTPSRASQPAE
jgi:hypothetical protein